VPHAEKLSQEYQSVFDFESKRQINAHEHRNGFYVEFASSNGEVLAELSLENRAQDIQLLNVRKEEGETGRMLATVFVPHKRHQSILKKIKDYKEEQNKKPNKEGEFLPKNKLLVESIASINRPLLNSFWTDERNALPGEDREWVEVWLSTRFLSLIEMFLGKLDRQKIQHRPLESVLRFPDRSVVLVFANAAELLTIIERTDYLAEFRAAREPSGYLRSLTPKEQGEWAQDLSDRLEIAADAKKLSVCILDVGVNSGHFLLQPLFGSGDIGCIDESWGADDRSRTGHGTLMAGLAGYGDLLPHLISRETTRLTHVLESVKILPNSGRNAQDSWGWVTAEGIYRAEINAPTRKRIICLATSVRETQDRGKPSSWSARLDSLAFTNDLESKAYRLICVCAGNADYISDWKIYPDGNISSEVHDPGQAWNALTVGSSTNLIEIRDEQLPEHQPLAQAGCLSPFSTTSNNWADHKPVKPEILFEGGNVAVRGETMTECSDLELLSTFHSDSVQHIFEGFSMTSASTALAANFGARILAQYPDLWPETVRGILVHSARWTDAMKRQFNAGATKSSRRTLLRSCGYGVPSLERATECFSNRATMVVQSSIQPFKKKDSCAVINEMHIHDLPFPKDLLLSLGATEVKMRVTLSYFIEPCPGERGRSSRYSYASHGLRFNVKSPSESERDFEKRINVLAREDDEDHPGTESASDYWYLGSSQRDGGSLHSDIWEGSAADLATSNRIAIYPVGGWWKDRPTLEKCDSQARYALIISIETPSEEMDVWTPIAETISLDVNLRTAIEVQNNE
jgi:hypothetical protein